MEQRNAIVTGGLRGLGRAMALGLAREGCHVLAVGHIETDVAEIERDVAGTAFADRLHVQHGRILGRGADRQYPPDLDPCQIWHEGRER